jgi:hypothetical protein
VKAVEKKAAAPAPLKVEEALASRPQPTSELPAQALAPTAAQAAALEPPLVPRRPVALALKGIIWDARAPLAIVNDAVLGLNDTVEGFKVVSIEQERIVLEDGQGQRKALNLYSE